MIKFSIILPTYNRAHTLSKAINSIHQQTFRNWELIIIDDGSTDNTKNVVENYLLIDQRIKYLFQINSERSAARNKGIEIANGEWICFLDSDSIYTKERLFNIYNFIENKNLKTGVIYTDILYQNENGPDYLHLGISFKGNNITNELLKKVIATPQLCIKKEVLESQQFNINISTGEDSELLIRIALKKHSFFYLKENRPSVIETYHENRSVNPKFGNVINNKATWDYIFDQNYANKISYRAKRNKRAHLEEKRGVYYARVAENNKAMFYILKSIFLNPLKNIKYKLNLLFYLLFLPSKVKKLI